MGLNPGCVLKYFFTLSRQTQWDCTDWFHDCKVELEKLKVEVESLNFPPNISGSN